MLQNMHYYPQFLNIREYLVILTIQYSNNTNKYNDNAGNLNKISILAIIIPFFKSSYNGDFYLVQIAKNSSSILRNNAIKKNIRFDKLIFSIPTPLYII